MSLNKIANELPNDVKYSWMNINCNDLKATTATIDTLDIDAIDIKKLEITGNVPPQLKVLNPGLVGDCQVICRGGDRQQIGFIDNTQTAVGTLESSSSGFSINPNTKNNVQILGPLQLEKTSFQSNPPATYVSLYSKSGSDDLFIKNSSGVERNITPAIDSGTYPSNITVVSGGVNLNVVSLTTYTIIGDMVTVCGQFGLDVTASTLRVNVDLVTGTTNTNTNRSGVCVGNKAAPGGTSFINDDIVITGGKIGLILNSCNNAAVTPANNLNTVFNFTVQYQIN